MESSLARISKLNVTFFWGSTLKDFAVVNGWLEERPLFEGELDVGFVIALLKKYQVSADLIVENAKGVENYKHIRNQLETIIGGLK